MIKDDKEYVLRKIKNEGFEYCFVSYSDFEDVNDEKFHELRKAYLDARIKLLDYLGTNKY